MNKFILVLLILIVPLVQIQAQILIGEMNVNTIYSNTKNEIEYVGNCDCNGLTASIQGYSNPIIFNDCKIKIYYLSIDTSTFEIRNQQGVIIFDTILLKNKNQIKAYLQLDKKIIVGGAIERNELQYLKKLSLKYPCPWMKTPKTNGFYLTVVDIDNNDLSYKIESDRIPDRYIQEILILKNPKMVYIDAIQWIPIWCGERIKSIALKVIN